MGRPPKPQQEVRNQTLRVRVTRDELNTLKRLAADLGITVAKYARGAVLSGAARPVGPRRFDLDVAKLITTISPIAVNVNQIARVVNSSQHLPRHPSLDACCAELIEVIKQIKAAIS